MKFTDSHEWVLVKDGIAHVGISAHAQRELGDIVYIELPKVGDELNKQEEAAVIESTKAAADIYAPITGKVIAVNEKLADDIDLLNRDPEGEGWLFQLAIKKTEECEDLLSSDQYAAMIS